MNCSCNHLLESLAIHAIAPLFNKIVKDFITFLSSFFSSSLSDDSETEEIVHIMKVIESMHYLDNRELIQKLGAILDLCLNMYKSTWPKEFQKFAWMNLTLFNLLVHNLENEEIFQNNSAHRQISIDRQILIVLIRFGSYESGASMSKIGFLYGVGYDTVDLVTQWVITAIQSSNMGHEYIRWPSEEEKKVVKN